jgi:group I intron endonuclease
MKKGYIYTLSEPDTGIVRYVGQTVDLKKRYWLHLYWAKKSECKTYKEKWISQVIEKGRVPEMEVIWEGDVSELNRMEIGMIKLFKAVGAKLTNATTGGDTTTGRKCSDETKAKLSAKFKGRKIPFEITEEWKAKVKEGRKGFRHTDQSKAKLRAARIGKPSIWTTKAMPEEFKRAIAERGKMMGKKVMGVYNGVITEYNSINEAHLKTGCDRKDIRSVINGIYKQIKGHQFKFI